MIVYNVTTKIDSDVEDKWITWMKEIHVPEVMNTGCFSEYKFLKLLNAYEIENDNTYAIQYFAPNKASYDKYIDEYSKELREKNFEKWGNKFAAFRTLMEVLE